MTKRIASEPVSFSPRLSEAISAGSRNKKPFSTVYVKPLKRLTYKLALKRHLAEARCDEKTSPPLTRCFTCGTLGALYESA
jgi:hypothetical protein